MTEQKTRKRGWIKNVVIIFLAVMLLLTFLSNTIMNRTLPEVAAQYVSSGSVTTRIRGSGTVTANENYEVKLTQSRKVQSVAVRVGDEVSVGDTLVYLSADAAGDLKDAENLLEDMEFAYEKALLSAVGSDYARENRDIANAQEDLAEAEAARDRLPEVTQEDLDAAQAAIDEAKRQTEFAQAAVDEAQTALDALGGLQPGVDGGDYSAVIAAENALDAKKVLYGQDYDELKGEAERLARKLNALSDTAAVSENLSGIYMSAFADAYSASAAGGKTPAFVWLEVELDTANKGTVSSRLVDEDPDLTAEGAADRWYKITAEQYTAYSAITPLKQAYEDAYRAYFENSYGGNEYEWNRLNRTLTEQKNVLSEKTKILESAQKALEELTAARSERKQAEDSVKAYRTTLEDLVFSLQEQQKADNISSAITSMELEAQRKDIEEKRAEVEQMRAEAAGTTLESAVAGTVKSVSVSAGDTVSPDVALMTIEVGDRGYTLSFSVTNEQAKKVHIGDTAEVSNYYWGGDITASLLNIRNDPESPQTNKLLTFEVSGDIEAGTQLTLSVGQKSASYDMIIPNSALKSDANGDFVLVVIAKSSPLGNRYIVQRADVKVLASDDTNTAVSGSLAGGDYVITTATAPVEPGMQVRIAES